MTDEVTTISIPAYHYAHILNLNTNIASLVIGPKTYVCQEHERILCHPEKMITVGTKECCLISNPVVKSEGRVCFEASGQVKLRLGEKEYRFAQDPFPLYPGEELAEPAHLMPVVTANKALRLRALSDCELSEKTYKAGEEWLFMGPGVYHPNVEIQIVAEVEAMMIQPNTALKFRALCDCIDRMGVKRTCGERWLVSTVGAYLPTVYEQYEETLDSIKLDEKTGAHLRSVRSHVDRFGKQRTCGDEWLVTSKDAESYLCDINEELVSVVKATTLTKNQFCIILNPVDENGQPQFGKRKLVLGEASFFLMPGESLESGVHDVYTLGPNDGLVLRAAESITEESTGESVQRSPGDRWLIRGPMEYVPPVGIEVISRRAAIPLGEKEGIYIRNNRTGHIRAVIGCSYMLSEDEEHWKKELSPEIEELLGADNVPSIGPSRFAALHDIEAEECMDEDAVADLDRPCPVVSLQVPHNAAVQVYDHQAKVCRVEFGPVLVMLGPHEEFTLLSLSGGRPKRPHMIKTLYLLLGPDYFTDLAVVETADHARLNVQLSYNWIFNVPDESEGQAEAVKLFSVPDFVGDACKTMASRIRAAVAAIPFDTFHKNSARIIRCACLGLNNEGKVNEAFEFPENRLRITNVDVQAVTPTDEKTRELLLKSVQQAIEISTKSLEAAARHEADRDNQEARGRLERQKISDDTEAEKSNTKLAQLRIAADTLKITGKAKAIAMGRAEARHIEDLTKVEQAKLKVQRKNIEVVREIERLDKIRQAEIRHIEARNALDLKRQKTLAEIEASKFTRMVSSVGRDTVGLMATAGSTHDIRMLQALGLRSTLITDGSTPVNLINTSNGLIGNPTGMPTLS
ncbi:unnamed protein product [Calicophoron daubneyi]|uniref:Major vault protein n=1 Tax=Calicophoron daubneyi TaxID=300641 RepID=A0AAV2TBM6_CALDB